MRIIRIAIFLLSVGFISFAIADQVPVEDLSQNVQANAPATDQTQAALPAPTSDQVAFSSQIASPVQQSLSLDQRVGRLEQQMNNVTQMNLSQQLSDMQQQLQQLRGELDVEQHNLQLLNEQLRSFYSDLMQQIKQQKSISDDNDSTNSAPVMSKLVTTTEGNSTGTLSDKDHDAYQAAFNLLLKKQYQDASGKLQDYLNNFPNGKYAANAHYWLGEIYFLQSALDKSLQEFTVVVSKYPQGSKVADASYKIAVIHAVQGKSDQAKKEFNAVIKNYSGSAAAKLAASQLNKMQ